MLEPYRANVRNLKVEAVLRVVLKVIGVCVQLVVTSVSVRSAKHNVDILVRVLLVRDAIVVTAGCLDTNDCPDIAYKNRGE